MKLVRGVSFLLAGIYPQRLVAPSPQVLFKEGEAVEEIYKFAKKLQNNQSYLVETGHSV